MNQRMKKYDLKDMPQRDPIPVNIVFAFRTSFVIENLKLDLS